MSKTVHDEIDVSPIQSARTLHVIRQDRYSIDDEICYLVINGTYYEVTDFSAFGIAILVDKETPETNEYRETQLIFDGVVVADLHLRVARSEELEDGNVKVAFEVLGEPIHVERVQAVRQAQDILKAHDQRFRQLEVIPEKARLLIYQLKDWFEELQSRVNSLTKSNEELDGRRMAEFENTLIPIIGTYIGEEFPKHYQRLAEPLVDLPAESRKVLVELFRSKLCGLIHQSPFAHRVYHKPLGYAGDFEMMNLIYRSENIGNSLFARCLQYYSVREPAAQAVRNRADYLTLKISNILRERSDEELRILSVACGPSREWVKLISEVKEFNSRSLHVDLLDQDKGALKYAQRSIKEVGFEHPHHFSFHFIHKAMKNVIARGVEGGDYDIIYCAGLFDYLSDPVAQLAAVKLFKSLRSGGSLIIGNFNLANPNEVIMDLALDWHLIYRSSNDLQSLFENIGGKLSIESENLGINLFCVIRKD